jgi:hypothetical protein
VIEGRDRDRDLGEPLFRHRTQQVDVAGDERRLRYDADRMPRARQHLEDLARDAVAPLDRLIGVGVRSHRDRLRLVSRRGELALEECCGVGLGEELRLEIEPGGEPLISVARAREAIEAAVLAAAIGVDRTVEADIGRGVSGDDRLRLLQRHLRLAARDLLRDVPAVVEFLAARLLEAPGIVRARPAPAPHGGIERRRSHRAQPRRLPGIETRAALHARASREQLLATLQRQRTLKARSGAHGPIPSKFLRERPRQRN